MTQPTVTPPSPSMAQLGQIVEDIATSMTKVATNIAMLGVEGNADEQTRIITEENNKVLDRIRQLYQLPPAPER
ncbi:Ras family protein [Acidovorax sp. SUPP3334]|uniref:Ras family protein n=1 Tax=Acidovorax sp. SUPP3334 TaxID=2920881 RepID=UPI0023DE2EA6|nr:Ras family protein [Acidovorax sp. SUPP3334]GKT26509.1 Ras family protein [Acidovorax sp. SUPP3334]